MIITNIVYGTADYDAEVKLRDEVLRKPLGLSFTPSYLEADREDIHFGAFDGSELIGCLLLTKQPQQTLKMRQVAVSAKVQGRGVGKKLVQAAEDYARKNEFKTIRLAARETAIPFYLSLGYTLTGEPFTEVNLPHRTMIKTFG